MLRPVEEACLDTDSVKCTSLLEKIEPLKVGFCHRVYTVTRGICTCAVTRISNVQWKLLIWALKNDYTADTYLRFKQ